MDSTNPPPNVTRWPIYRNVASVFFPLVYLVVGMRLTCRIKSKQGLWLDDWLIILSIILGTAMYLTTMIGFQGLIGYHMYYVDPSRLPSLYKSWVFEETTYAITLGVVKFSILCLYWRTFSSALRLPIILVGVIVFAWMWSVFFIGIFRCRPISAAWDPTLPGAVCIDTKKFFIGAAVPNIVTDLILVLMPVPYVMRLRMPADHQIAVIGTFLLGGLTTIVSLVRAIVFMQEDLSNDDFTWNMATVCLWTGVEVEAAVISACLPTLKPILNFLRSGEMFPVRLDSNGSAGRGHNNNQRNDEGYNNMTGTSTNVKVSLVNGKETSTVRSGLSKYYKKFSIAPLSLGALSSVGSSRSRDSVYGHEREGSFTRMINIVKTYEVTSEEHLHINDPSGFMAPAAGDDDDAVGSPSSSSLPGGLGRTYSGPGGGGVSEDRIFDSTTRPKHREDTQIYHQPECRFTPDQPGWNTISTSRER